MDVAPAGRHRRRRGDRVVSAALGILRRLSAFGAEREIVAHHAELGVKAERVPLSGAARYRGNGADIDVYAFGPAAAPIVGR